MASCHEEPIDDNEPIGVLEYTSFELNSIEDGNQVDSIYTDFSKTFDCVRHQLYVGIEPARCM
jgi:hypothetical protein